LAWRQTAPSSIKKGRLTFFRPSGLAMSCNQNPKSAPSTDAVARRLLESFLDDVNEFARSGGFRNSTESERRALNDLMTQRYLVEGIAKLPPSPIVKKVNEIIRDFIHNKCRALEYCALERVKEENSCGDDNATTTSWSCVVCGKVNQKKQRICVVCGRNRNYQGSKKTQQLNKLRIDPTPLSTIASKECLKEAQKSNKRTSCPAALNSFMATKADYEELQRCEMKSEINDILESVRSIMDGMEYRS
jgi:hypothetical protein